MLLPPWAAHSLPGQNWSWASGAIALAKSAPCKSAEPLAIQVSLQGSLLALGFNQSGLFIQH